MRWAGAEEVQDAAAPVGGGGGGGGFRAGGAEASFLVQSCGNLIWPYLMQ